jgi:hypothetical protein
MIRTIRILAISIALSMTALLQAEVMDITVTSQQQASLTYHFENRQAPVPEPPRNEKIDKFVKVSDALAIFLWKNIGYSLGELAQTRSDRICPLSTLSRSCVHRTSMPAFCVMICLIYINSVNDKCHLGCTSDS